MFLFAVFPTFILVEQDIVCPPGHSPRFNNVTAASASLDSPFIVEHTDSSCEYPPSHLLFIHCLTSVAADDEPLSRIRSCEYPPSHLLFIHCLTFVAADDEPLSRIHSAYSTRAGVRALRSTSEFTIFSCLTFAVQQFLSFSVVCCFGHSAHVFARRNTSADHK